MRPVVRQFIERGLVPESARSKFDAALASALRLRNSCAGGSCCCWLSCYAVGVLVIWRTRSGVERDDVVRAAGGRRLHPTLAGWWFMSISLPLFQFILLRWYFRLFIWARFLWQVARIDLRLVPTHPDQAGGLGFLSNAAIAFAPLLLGQGALLAGWLADRIFFDGRQAAAVQSRVAGRRGLCCCSLCWDRCWSLCRTWRGPGAPASGNTARWPAATCVTSTRNGCAQAPPRDATAAGQPDLQSLADLGNSFADGARHEAGAFWQGHPPSSSRDDPAAGAAADPDHDLTGRVAQPTVEGRFLTSAVQASNVPILSALFSSRSRGVSPLAATRYSYWCLTFFQASACLEWRALTLFEEPWTKQKQRLRWGGEPVGKPLVTR